MSLEPDGKDWTWVLTRACAECGFDAPALSRQRIPGVIRDNATHWEVVLGTDDAAVRPSPHVWSPLEYACHVRDVNRIFAQRVRQMLTEDAPTFANWDQDQTAIDDDYGSQDPSEVASAVVTGADEVASLYAAVRDDQWDRSGTRSNGDGFTVDTLARYHLHDLVHHAHDVSHITKRVTVASYDAFAAQYRSCSEARPYLVGEAVERFAATLPVGARVLEVGSGPGRDARALEAVGLSVRRTDITPAFVAMLRADGFAADVIDPLTDDLSDPARAGAPYDGVWAGASLLHVDRAHMPEVVRRLGDATRAGGVLHMSLKEGDGERWAMDGDVGGPRRFVYWRAQPVRELLGANGWSVDDVYHWGVPQDRCLDVLARRA